MTASGALIVSGTLSGLRALGSGGASAVDVHSQISRDLRATLGEAHAALFAEPSVDGMRIDWFAAASQARSAPTRLQDAPDDRRRAGEQRLRELARAVLARGETLGRSDQPAQRILGEMMRNALEIPEEGAIWLIEDQPVLTFWGFVRDADRTPPGLVAGIIRRRDAAAETQPDTELERELPQAPPRRTLGKPLAVALLALLAMIFMSGIALSLLRACALGLPASLTGWVIDYCPISADDRIKDDILDAQAQQLALQEQLNTLATKVALDEQARALRRAAAAEPRASKLAGCWRTEIRPIQVPEPDRRYEMFCLDAQAAGFVVFQFASGRYCQVGIKGNYPAADEVTMDYPEIGCNARSEFPAYTQKCRSTAPDHLDCSWQTGNVRSADKFVRVTQQTMLPPFPARPGGGALSAIAGCWREPTIPLPGSGPAAKPAEGYWTTCLDAAGDGWQLLLASDGGSCMGPAKAAAAPDGKALISFDPDRCARADMRPGGAQSKRASMLCNGPAGKQMQCNRVAPPGQDASVVLTRIGGDAVPQPFQLVQPDTDGAERAGRIAGCWAQGRGRLSDNAQVETDVLYCFDPSGAGLTLAFLSDARYCTGPTTSRPVDGKLALTIERAQCSPSQAVVGFDLTCSFIAPDQLSCDGARKDGQAISKLVLRRVRPDSIPKPFPSSGPGRSPINFDGPPACAGQALSCAPISPIGWGSADRAGSSPAGTRLRDGTPGVSPMSAS